MEANHCSLVHDAGVGLENDCADSDENLFVVGLGVGCQKEELGFHQELLCPTWNPTKSLLEQGE